jgi:hypothetical protein
MHTVHIIIGQRTLAHEARRYEKNAMVQAAAFNKWQPFYFGKVQAYVVSTYTRKH